MLSRNLMEEVDSKYRIDPAAEIVNVDHEARTTPGLFNDGHDVEEIVKDMAATGKSLTGNSLKKVYEAHNGPKTMPMIYCGGIHHCPPGILHLMLGMYRMVLFGEFCR